MENAGQFRRDRHSPSIFLKNMALPQPVLKNSSGLITLNMWTEGLARAI